MPSGRGHSRWLSIALQIAVSAGLIAVLAFNVDWSEMKTALAALSPVTLLVGFALYFGAQAAMVWRWRALIAACGVHEPTARSWHTIFGGQFLMNFLPGTLGADGLRILLLTRACQSAMTAIAAIVFDRAMQLVFYAMVTALALAWPVPLLPPALRALLFIGALLGIATIVVLFWRLGRRPLPGTDSGAGALRRALRLAVTSAVETGRMQSRLRRQRAAFFGFWFWSLVSTGLIFGLYRVILLDMGHDLGLPAIALVAGMSAIVVGIPISVGGVGLYEAAVVALFGLYQVPVEHAFLMALTIRCVVVAVNLTGLPSALLLWRERRLGT